MNERRVHPILRRRTIGLIAAAVAVTGAVAAVVFASGSGRGVVFDGSVDLGPVPAIPTGHVEIRTINSGITDRLSPVNPATLQGEGVRSVRLSPVLVAIASTSADSGVLLARDTQSGCRLTYSSDIGGWTTKATGAGFVDPCHGAVYAVTGKCIDGPCTRDLDGLATHVDARNHLIVDLASLTAGLPAQR
jgi:hypothetical protein